MIRNDPQIAAAFIVLGVFFASSVPFTVAAKSDGVTVERGASPRILTIDRGKSIVLKFAKRVKRISVNNPNVVEAIAVSPLEVLLNTKKAGTTSLLVWDETDTIFTYSVIVQRDVKRIEEVAAQLAKVLPKEKLTVEQAGDNIVLSGTVSSEETKKVALRVGEANAPKKVVDNIRVIELPPQVLLKVHFAEISRSGALKVGIGFIRTNREARNHLSFFPGAPGFSPKDDFIPEPGAAPGPNLTFSSVIDFFFGTGFLEGSQARSVGFFMRALQEQGHIRTLAEPTLRVVSGKKANFLVGGEAPIPVPGQDGSVTIAYKPFGIQLEFTPKVKENGMVELNVKPEVSSIDNTISIVVQGFNIPGFKKSNTSTQVELRDGQTMAISGLLSESTAKNLGKVPFIGDVPILGELFKSRDFQDNKSELIVLITPTVIRQEKVEDLVLPRTGFMMGRAPGESGSPGKREGKK